MISLDLITVVIGKEAISSYDGESYISRIVRIKVEDNSIKYNFSDGCINHTSIMYDGEINIYELAHKCQEWAYSYGYIVQGYFYNKKARADLLKSYDISEKFINDTIPEAIFMACEFVLKSLKDQK